MKFRHRSSEPLEQFLTFTIGNPDLPEAITKLADEDTSEKYRALDRFINRGAHADGVNGSPVDWSDYDAEYLLGKFRAMFKALNQEEHFLKRVGVVAEEVQA